MGRESDPQVTFGACYVFDSHVSSVESAGVVCGQPHLTLPLRTELVLHNIEMETVVPYVEQLEFDFPGVPRRGPGRVFVVPDNIKQKIECARDFLVGRLRLPYQEMAFALTLPNACWYEITKKVGDKQRTFYVSRRPLAEMQRRIATYLEDSSKWERWSMRKRGSLHRSETDLASAFRRGTSIITNAWPHRVNRSSLTLDLRDAFESITRRHVERYLTRIFANNITHPVQSPEVTAWVLSRLVTCRGKLLQGPPSSPAVFNCMLERLDDALAEATGAPKRDVIMPAMYLGMRFQRYRELDASDRRSGASYVAPRGVLYTRYADDLCFSHPDETFPIALEEMIRKVVASHGFRINGAKTRHGRYGILEFPGVVVANGHLRPKTRLVQEILEGVSIMTAQERAGYRAFLHQFGPSGRLECLRVFDN